MKNNKFIKTLIGLVVLIFGFIFIPGCGYTQTQQIENTSNGQSSNYDSSYSNQNGNNGYYNTGNYDQTLNEYGNWIMISPYGNVWKPFVAATWQPYYYGYWVYSDYGWTWVSYEPFGWIVYHYGYWVDNPYYGWLWVPSSDPWSPARVDWYDSGDYVCWAPLPPPGISYGTPWDTQRPVWRVVQYNNFTQNDLSNYYVDNSMLRNNMGGRGTPSRRPPNLNYIRTRVPGGVPVVKIQKVDVKTGSRKVIRMKVPKEQQRIIERHAPEIQRTVIQRRNPPVIKRENRNNIKKEKRPKRQEQPKKQEPQKKGRQKHQGNFQMAGIQYLHRANRQIGSSQNRKNISIFNRQHVFPGYVIQQNHHPVQQRHPQYHAVNRPRYTNRPHYQRPIVQHRHYVVQQKRPQYHAVNRARYNYHPVYHRHVVQYRHQQYRPRVHQNHTRYYAGRRNNSRARRN